MSEDAHAAAHLAQQATHQADARVASPTVSEMIDSLAADYKAGRLPDDVKARIDTVRDEWLESAEARLNDLKADLKPDIDVWLADVKAQMQASEAEIGPANSEVLDTRQITPLVTQVDGGLTIFEPVFDAVEDVVRDAFSLGHELLQIRADYDPEGIYASKLPIAQEEMQRADERLDADMDQLHDGFAAAHDALDTIRTEMDEFHAQHGPVQIIMSTTVDPHLPEQMNEETGEGAA